MKTCRILSSKFALYLLFAWAAAFVYRARIALILSSIAVHSFCDVYDFVWGDDIPEDRGIPDATGGSFFNTRRNGVVLVVACAWALKSYIISCTNVSR